LDTIPEQAFYMKGSIDEVVEDAKKLEKEEPGASAA
jgi:F0F1-type ATP synthase beta subunit